MTQLSKLDIAALRQGDTLCVHLGGDWAKNGVARVIKRARVDAKNPFAQDVEHILPAEVRIRHSAPAVCFASVSFYHSQHTSESYIIKTLRAGDELRFTFWPDAHTNQYCRDANLHADVLMLDVLRNGKQIASWELASSICPDNSARMCRGIEYRLVA